MHWMGLTVLLREETTPLKMAPILIQTQQAIKVSIEFPHLE